MNAAPTFGTSEKDDICGERDSETRNLFAIYLMYRWQLSKIFSRKKNPADGSK